MRFDGSSVGVVGGKKPSVASSAISAAALAEVLQTPGVSQVLGCTPLGPVGWAIGLGASTTAAGLSLVAPWAIEREGRSAPSVLGEVWDFETPSRERVNGVSMAESRALLTGG